MSARAFEPYDLSGTKLQNRIVLASTTRTRTQEPGALPTSEMATRYAERADAGLIVAEGSQPSVVGQGYIGTPGLHSADQVAAWKDVTDAVHKQGGVVFAQLMHTGRIGHPSLLPDGLVPVAPSAIRPAGQAHTDDGPRDFVTPNALTEAEILATIEDFANAARNAIDAGFDGVEINAANGYLIHQFLSVNANQRTDQWGGSAENRIRFAVEVARTVADAIGPDRTGVLLSPGAGFNDVVDDANLGGTYLPLTCELAELDLAYLHLMEQNERSLTVELRASWYNTFILNPNTGSGVPSGPDALTLIDDDVADLISYSAAHLTTPDLMARLVAGEDDRATR